MKKKEKKLEKAVNHHLRKSNQEFDKLEVILQKELQGQPLTPTESKRLNQYLRVIELRQNGYPDTEVIKLLQVETGLSRQRCYQVIDEATELFGKQTTIHKEAERYFKANRLEELAFMAMEEIKQLQQEDNPFLLHNKESLEVLKFAKDCLSEAAKLKNLYSSNEQKQIPAIPVIVISSNSQSLEVPTIDIEVKDE